MVTELKRERTLLVILIITCAAMWQISTANAADYVPVLRFLADDVYVVAGQENQIKITLTNVGTWNIYEAKISLSVPATTPGVSIVENGHLVYSIIEDGKSKSFYPVLYVDESTPLGAYSLTLTAVYMKKVQYGTSMLESTSLQVGIVVARARDMLLEEVTAMVEWPVAIAGQFEKRFLVVPQEALISTMSANQKYFHLVDQQNKLLPYFITVSNIESRDEAKVQAGNERVIRPRFATQNFSGTRIENNVSTLILKISKPLCFNKSWGLCLTRHNVSPSWRPVLPSN